MGMRKYKSADLVAAGMGQGELWMVRLGGGKALPVI